MFRSCMYLATVIAFLVAAPVQADEAEAVANWLKQKGGMFRHHTSNNGGPGYEILFPQSATDADLKAFLALKPTQTWHLNLAPSEKLTAAAVKQLRDLPKLDYLRVPKTTTDEAVQHIVTTFPNLRTLVLQESKVTNAGLRSLVKLKKLQSLYLSATPITDDCWKEIAAITSLNHVSVASNPQLKCKGIRQLAALKNLHRLGLDGTALSDNTADEIAQLTNLHVLNLFQRPITDAFIAKIKALTELRELNLDYCPISDRAISDLSQFKKLEAIFISGTRITNQGAAKLKKALPDCRVVR